MLGYLLAVLVGTGSAGLYVAAFFFPEIHRKPDFIWGGVGLFYALALWIYAPEMTGGILVGQAASVALLGWFGWQTIKLRQLVPIDWQTSRPITKAPQRAATKPTDPAPAKSAANKPLGKPSAPAIEAQSPAAKSAPARSIESHSPPVNSAPSKQDAARATRSTVPGAQTVPNNISAPKSDRDEEAWIKLEVKPTPTPPPPIGEVVRSTPPAPPPQTFRAAQTPPAKPQPESVPTPPAAPQPIPTTIPTPSPAPVVQSSPPPPPAKPPTIPTPAPATKPQPVTEVINITFPTPPIQTADRANQSQQTYTPPSSPQKIETVPPALPSQPQQPATNQARTAPAEPPGELDRLIAELKSEIEE